MENLARGRRVFEPERYMSAKEAAVQLVDIAASAAGTDEAQCTYRTPRVVEHE